MNNKAQYFIDWHKTGDDTKLKVFVGGFWNAFIQVYPSYYLNMEVAINNFIDGLINFLKLEDKNIILTIRKYVKYFFQRYYNENYQQDIKWYSENYQKILNKQALEYEILLKDLLSYDLYDKIIKRWNQLAVYYKIDKEASSKVKERLDRTIINFKIENVDGLKDIGDVIYYYDKDKIIYELPVYFIKQQYEKHGKLDKEDLQNFINKNKILHEVTHILQQKYLLSNKSKEYGLEENKNWDDITERAADRNTVWYIKKYEGEDSFNKFIESYKKEYYNYLVNNKLGINFGDPNNLKQLKKLQEFVQQSMSFINIGDVSKVNFNDLMKLIKLYSEMMFENTEWYENAKRHWKMAHMFDKDIPKEIWGKLKFKLIKIANELEKYGMYKESSVVDKIILIGVMPEDTMAKVAWDKSKYEDRIPKALEPLLAEARKHNTFEEFEKAFLGHITHGRYWHITDDPDFAIKNIAPRDLSSMASGSGIATGLMVSVAPEYWAVYFPKRKFAAEIDMSNSILGKDYVDVNRGFGQEFFIHNLNSVKVKQVIPLQKAIRSQNTYYSKYLPDSSEQLRKVWELVHLGLDKLAQAKNLYIQLNALRPQMVIAAQSVYNDWDPDEEGFDMTLGSGGVCDEIARAISEVIALNIADIEIVDMGQDGDDHAYILVYDNNESYTIDIPYNLYEKGGGYNWTKIPGVIFKDSNIEIYPIEIDRKALEQERDW